MFFDPELVYYDDWLIMILFFVGATVVVDMIAVCGILFYMEWMKNNF